MKTPIQEAIETIKEYRNGGCPDVDTCNTILLHLASMLEKEKEQRMEAWCNGYDSYDEDISGDSPLEYYNKIFNTKEK